MQLPADEELVLVSGCPPIRAGKVRYFIDPRLARRVIAPPELAPSDEPAREVPGWSDLGPVAVATGGEADGGLRWEPELAPPDVASTDRLPSEEFVDFDDEQDQPGDGGLSEERDAFRRRSGLAARQASLDPDDGIDL